MGGFIDFMMDSSDLDIYVSAASLCILPSLSMSVARYKYFNWFVYSL